jgi:hypothetical protein
MKFLKSFRNKNIQKEILTIIEANGFVIEYIYDVENISGLIGSMKLNNVLPKFLYEDVDFELDEPGGVIIFSTDLNATLENAKTFKEKVKYFFESKWKTFFNRLNLNSRLNKILLDEYELPGFTVGKNFKGSYKSKNGTTFNEKSYTVDIAGVSSDILKLISTKICREFKQEVVMVRDFNKDSIKVYFVNDKNNFN